MLSNGWGIGLILILGIVLTILLIFQNKIKKNKYYFWKFEWAIKDRNGCRKPGQQPQFVYGDFPPHPNEPRDNVLKKASKPQSEFIPEIFKISINKDKTTYEISFSDGKLVNGGIRVVSNGHTYSSFSEDISPKDELSVLPLFIKDIKEEEGTDAFGRYKNYFISWFSKNKEVLILTTIKHYKSPSCIMFRIEFPIGLEKPRTNSYTTPCVEFPVFRNHSNRSLVFTYADVNFSEPVDKFIPTSGPIIFYNEDLKTLILSPTMNFLIAMHAPSTNIAKMGPEIRMGLEGDLKEIPENFLHETILAGGVGITNTFEYWGNLLLRYYQRDRFPPHLDVILDRLGYWTDAGTDYYYNYDNYKNYEELIMAIKSKSEELNIPYNYIQLDSWFYPKDDGCLIWDADPELFPNGIRSIVERTQWPVICHNRWFSANTPYKTKYDNWITETHPKITGLNPTKNHSLYRPRSKYKNKDEKSNVNELKKSKDLHSWSLPINPQFWVDLMATARSWGCISYEQDWLQPQWRFFNYLRENVYAGQQWLKQMGEATRSQGLTQQYCMTFPSFYMASLELGNVSHARCADDYNRQKPKRIYIPHFTQTSMLSWAVGVWPWKDSFVTKQGGDKWGELELILQVLSGGPVGNGDKIENFNPYLLLQSCRDDGVILKPDRPAFPIEKMFLSHNNIYWISTFSTIQGAKWYYLLGVNIWKNKNIQIKLTLNDLGLNGKYVLYNYHKKKIDLIESEEQPFGPDSTIISKENEFYYGTLAPVLSNGMAFIGCWDKYITMSSRLFKKCMVIGRGLHIEGVYSARSEFSVIAYVPYKPKRVSVNGIDTDKFTWGPNFKTLIVQIFSDEGPFSLIIE